MTHEEHEEFIRINPNDLVIGANIRTDADIDDDFLESITNVGVLTPILVHRDDTGAVRVLAGQRRTVAAVMAGLDSIPARIVAQNVEQADVDRIEKQWDENARRKGITKQDEIGAYEQLSAFGVSVTQIAKKLKVRPATVKKGLKVGADATAAKALADYDLTLDQAAVVAAVSDNDDDVAKLLDGATRGTFDHVAQRVQDERTERAAVAKTAAELAEQGVSVIDYAQTYSGGGAESLTRLSDQEGQPLTEESHAGCPGHAAAITYRWHSAETSVVWVCSDWKANGHRDRHNSSRASGALSDEEKRNRREVIANNKAWDSAETVRRDWLKKFLTRKTAPKDSGQVIARILTSNASTVARELGASNSKTGAELFGQEVSTGYGARSPLIELAEAASTGRAQVIALGIVLAAVESSLGRHSWRNPDRGTAEYLNTLAAWGYTTSEVENLITEAAL